MVSLLVVDLPMTVPLTVCAMLRSNRLRRGLVYEYIPCVAFPQVGTECLRNRLGENNYSNSALSFDSNPSVLKINILGTHGAKFASATSCPIENFNQRSFMFCTDGAQDAVELLLGQDFRQLSRQRSQFNHPGSDPLHQATEIQKIEENSQGVKFCSQRLLSQSVFRRYPQELLNVQMSNVQHASRTEEPRKLAHDSRVSVPCATGIPLDEEPPGEATSQFFIEFMNGIHRSTE